jgi:UDP:flavonoid glycosyltransferase YjiC (YdhE family)
MGPDVVLCTAGTRGDVAPFLVLGRALAGLGYSVELLANENWRSLAGEVGLSFTSIGPEDPPQCGRNDLAFFRSNVVPTFHRAFAKIGELSHAGARPCIVYKAAQLGAECAARRYRLASVRIALQPSAVTRSLALTPSFADRILGGIARRVSPYVRECDAFRRQVGGPPRRWEATCSGLTLLTCPSWFADPTPSSLKGVHCTGFLFGSPKPLSEHVRSFLASRPAPIVFTPGTGIESVANFFANSRRICAELGRPGVFLSPHLSPAAHEGVLSLAYVDLAALLPHAGLLVHHGGIGTTAEALRAGVPQLILPDRFDQPDNALRTARLGAGVVVLGQRDREAAPLIAAARAIADPGIRDAALTASRRLASEDGVAGALSAIVQRIAPASWSALPMLEAV